MQDDNLPSPRIIPRPEHPISRKNIDREALKVLYRLKDAGFTAYLVGGGVRDLLLGKEPKDFDISTDARPGQLKKLFKNSRIIGRRFRLVQVFFRGNKIVEVSTFRQRSEFDLNGEEKVLAANNTFGSPAEDAFRRDLTINGLFYEIENFSIIDYVGGVEDLHNGLIRIIGNAERRIIRDPVRMMRVIRHAARNDFAIDRDAWQTIVKHADKLKLCPISRIRDEFIKDLTAGASRKWATLAMDSGLFFILFPFYKDLLSEPESETRRSLLNVLGVIDRLYQNNSKLSEAMILALILFPWAETEMGILAKDRRGREAFEFQRQIRDQIEDKIGHFNIKRATKDTISGLLAHTRNFHVNSNQKGWPKWLKRKSYFGLGVKFYQIIEEARGGPQISGPVIITSPKTQSRKRSGKRGRAPAYAKNKGGIFGLKKKRRPS